MDFHLDRLLNFPSVTIEKCVEEEDKVNLNIKFINDSVACIFCNHETDKINQIRPLSVRDLSIFGKVTILQIDRRQFKCEHCQKHFTELIEFIDFDRHSTIRYQKYIYNRVKTSNITQVARDESLTFDRIKSMFDVQFKKKTDQQVKRISIDEFSHRKGRGNFATVVSNLDNSTLLEVIDSHKQEEIIEALLEWPLELRQQIEEVSVDMWGGFTKVIRKVFPNARIVIDRFHVMIHVNADLKKIIKQCKNKFKHLKIKNAKYLLLKNQEDLSLEEKEKLESILNCSRRLREAYELKEKFRAIYECSQTLEVGRPLMEVWVEQASKLYNESIKTIKNHFDGICNYFIDRTTSGVMEGINNKIKLIKRQAYGFTNFENLRIRLLACFS